jgi:hypothetical protein
MSLMQSTTLNKLKANLITELPFFPNNKETLQELEGQNLSEILIHYLHWKTRLIPMRQRTIEIAPEVTNDKRWPKVKLGINNLLEKIRQGEDVKPYLSKKAHSAGYTPIQQVRNGLADSWEDKDFLLNTQGFHHFHLNMTVQASGLSERTDDVLFAHVTRKKFRAIGIFDHSVFDSLDENGEITLERKRIWDLHQKYITLGMPDGSFYLSNPIMTSGHPMAVVRSADDYFQIISEYDSKLEDRNFVNQLYSAGNLSPPARFKLEWKINDLDLCLFDKKNNHLFIFREGPL